MKRTLLSCALAAATALAAAPPAQAAATQDFLDLCGKDERACAERIDEVRASYEKTNAKLCVPATMTREGYANEISYWIGEQQPPLEMAQPDSESIAAALKALYTCQPQGTTR
jgi:hypothetical protein